MNIKPARAPVTFSELGYFPLSTLRLRHKFCNRIVLNAYSFKAGIIWLITSFTPKSELFGFFLVRNHNQPMVHGIDERVLEWIGILSNDDESEGRKRVTIRLIEDHVATIIGHNNEDPLPLICVQWHRAMAGVTNQEKVAAGVLLRCGMEFLLERHGAQWLRWVEKLTLCDGVEEGKRVTARYCIGLYLDIDRKLGYRSSPSTRSYLENLRDGNITVPPPRAVLVPMDVPPPPRFSRDSFVPLLNRTALDVQIYDRLWHFALDRLHMVNYSRGIRQNIGGQDIVDLARYMFGLGGVEEASYGSFFRTVDSRQLGLIDSRAEEILRRR